MKNEKLDIYNGLMKKIGVKERDEVHANGDWHKTIHCWVIFRGEDGQDYVVLQRRSDQKSSWPGYVDITAAGHYLTGETAEDGAREIEEEIGLKDIFKLLIPLGTRVCVEDFKAGTINREFQDVYFLNDSRDLSNYILQGEELSGILQVKIDDLIALFSNDVISCNGDGLQITSDGVVAKNYIINKENFIPSIDNYNFKIMLLAKQALAGKKQLFI